MRNLKGKRSKAYLLAACMSLSCQLPVIAGPTEAPFNFAEALQKSLYFYDANKCGEGVTDGRLEWRGDCHLEDQKIPLQPEDSTGHGTNMSESFIASHKEVLDPDGDGCVDLSGGFHDAGDHVKFGLPQSYSASTLGWGYYEFKEAYVEVGEQEHIEDILRDFNDYFLRCTFMNEAGEVEAFAYQVGDGTTDHNYWGPPELQTTARPAYFATSETPASDQCAGAAASLAINYLNFKDSDPEYANTCLETAKALYTFAQNNRGLGFSGGFYNSSYDEDEMSWAAVWLNIATGEESYITDITAVDASGTYTGYMSRIISTVSSTWQNIWVHSWDTVWGGVFAKLAPITNDPEHWYFFKWNIEYWSGVPHENPADSTYLAGTPADFKVVNTWGSARYNAAAQLCALVYNKYDSNEAFVNWSKSQMDYILGDNPMHRAYEVGYSDISAVNPHHRAAHASETNSMLDPVNEKHVLWGALVGGPDQTDYHLDDRTDYVYNEVAIDYNAGFVGALAGLYEIYGEGQEPLADFPPKETPIDAYYATAKIEQENAERTQVTVKVHNDSCCPPQYESKMRANYFFNISELLEAGQTIDDLSIQVMYDQAQAVDGKGVTIEGPYAWDAEQGIYYITLDWSGIKFHGSREIHFGLIPAQDTNYKVHWDPANDWSHEGLTKIETKTEYVPVYIDDEKVYGKEPARRATISFVSPEANEVFDFTETQNPIDLVVEATSEDEAIREVIFYADGECIGTQFNAPYTCSYLPTNEDLAEEAYGKTILVSAEVITESGESVHTGDIPITVNFKKPEPIAATLTNLQEGDVLEVTEDNNSFMLVAESTGNYDNIQTIAIYADDVLIGSADATCCEAIYSAPLDEADLGTKEVTFKVVTTLTTGEIKTAPSIKVQVQYPTKHADLDTLTLQVEGKGELVANTISRKFKLTNIGTEVIDLSKVAIRYYMTNETQSTITCFCDHAGMTFDGAPWYKTVSEEITSHVIAMDEPKEGADTYVAFSFESIDEALDLGKSIDLEIRMAHSNWSNFDQSNDYSYDNPAHIVLMYDEAIVSGEMPQ